MTQRLSKACLFAAVSSMALSGAVYAQTDTEGASDRRTIDVVTVTAQQRQQSAQDVPISLGAYGAEELRAAGVQDIKDLISISPGLMVTSTQAETITTARIRGIGTVGDNFGLESSVGVYIDGVFRARNGVGFSDLGELERIEVLRGPQGTLFGKNTSAGVLNVVTASPEFEFGGSLQGEFGNFDYRRYSGHLTGPIGDTLAVRLFAAVGERDGFTNLTVREPGGTRETDSETNNYYTFRAQALWAPSDMVEGRFIADYTRRNEFCCSAVQWQTAPGPAALIGAVGGQVLNPADPSERRAFANREYQQQVTDYGFSAEFDIEMPIGTLTTITAWRDWRNQRTQDIDFTSADIAYRADGNSTNVTRFDQEIRLTGVTGDLDWLVGGIISHEDLTLNDAIRFGADWEVYLGLAASNGADPLFISNTLNAVAGGPLFAPGQALPGGSGVNQDVYNQTSTSWALFTHNTYQLTDQLAITGGLRYTNENKRVFATFDTSPVPGCAFLETVFGADPIAGSAGTPLAGLVPLICLPYARTGLDATGYDRSRTDEEISGTIRATYDVNDDVMVYAGFSRGFKAGGFNLDREFNGPVSGGSFTDSDSSFLPETIDAWEIGFKSQLFGNVLQLNGNAFYQEVTDFQLNTFTGLAFVVQNIPEIEARGVELDFTWATPIEGLDISGGYAHVRARYGNTPDTPANLAGRNISLSPENFVTGQALYSQPIADNLLFRAAVDARWVSEYNTGSDLAPGKEQPAFTMVNGRVGLGSLDGRWNVELWGRNLTDETYVQVAFDQFAQTGTFGGFLGAPRTWGVTLRTEW
ncbi:TonB-dependent receptor [Alkalicaulis satelles]|uniref:TonB-dependent receptor n=1 Tax=Alkalicaulis satelles TaxID=2609175 RepID=A0A5M6ZB35_9PROT|nr:TonB-dependent receptor [Alkalicaulis satelles]KAA5801605.1 TonB-dependent receptor [Alkalicaulis satelles]